MQFMEATHLEYIGLALFATSELIGMSRLRANSTVQLLLGIAVRAFPYELHRRSTPAPMLEYPEERPAPARRTSTNTRSRSTKTER